MSITRVSSRKIIAAGVKGRRPVVKLRSPVDACSVKISPSRYFPYTKINP